MYIIYNYVIKEREIVMPTFLEGSITVCLIDNIYDIISNNKKIEKDVINGMGSVAKGGE